MITGPQITDQENEVQYLLENKADILKITENARLVLACFEKLEQAKKTLDDISRFTEVEKCLDELNFAILIENIAKNREYGKAGTLQCTGRHFTRLSGRIFTLPELAVYWETLKVLALGDNKLKTLPVEISKLKSLKELRLSGNGLQSLPAEIGSLRNLVVLDLSKNHLSSLPAEMANLDILETLMLEANCLDNLPEKLEVDSLKNTYYQPISAADALATQMSNAALQAPTTKHKP